MYLHDALAPAGSDAKALALLWWVFLTISLVVYATVITALVLAIRRARRRRLPAGSTVQSTDRDARAGKVVAAALGLTTLILLGMLTTELVVGRAVLDESRPEGDAVSIRVTAQQFWWKLEYEDGPPGQRLVTANELFVPVGRPVELRLQSSDVIHSFWLPALAGKRDLIPGNENTLRFSVLRPGDYEGQCAEFCGYQHANMRLILTALDGPAFDAWKSAQLAEAVAPATDELQRGQWVFERSSCALCHAVRGTAARGTVGPDLTHFGARRRIAATPLRNTPATLASWIVDPQRLKPGSRMPATALAPDDLRALVAWLGSLQ